MLVTHAGLQARRENAELFAGGAYAALNVQGPRAANLCAFARRAGARLAIAVAPRLVAGLLDGPRLPKDAFAGTFLGTPPFDGQTKVVDGVSFRDVLTGEQRVVKDGKLAVDELFSTLPVALLIR